MTNLSKDHNSSKNQNIKRKFVEREVVHCASHLISSLAGLETDYQDEIYNVCSQPNYEECVNYHIEENMTIAECMEYLIKSNGKMPYKENAREQLRKYLDEHPDAKDFEEFAEEMNVEINQHIEAYEHWIVSDHLSRKLQEYGEMVENIMGFTIWGRCCTGQAILFDDVISRICFDMEILDGQKNEWEV